MASKDQSKQTTLMNKSIEDGSSSPTTTTPTITMTTPATPTTLEHVSRTPSHTKPTFQRTSSNPDTSFKKRKVPTTPPMPASGSLVEEGGAVESLNEQAAFNDMRDKTGHGVGVGFGEEEKVFAPYNNLVGPMLTDLYQVCSHSSFSRRSIKP